MTSLKDFSLEGKNAWITGASYGIGFNIAKAFVAAGVKNIIFNDIKSAKITVQILLLQGAIFMGQKM